MSSGSIKVAGAAAAGVGRLSYSRMLFVYVPVQGQNKANTRWRFVVSASLSFSSRLHFLFLYV